MLPPSSVVLLPNQQSAFATFPGDNGKIVFRSNRDGGNEEIYVMNADGSGQTRVTNNPTGVASLAGHQMVQR